LDGPIDPLVSEFRFPVACLFQVPQVRLKLEAVAIDGFQLQSDNSGPASVWAENNDVSVPKFDDEAMVLVLAEGTAEGVLGDADDLTRRSRAILVDLDLTYGFHGF
jgi:hypothetical protein